MKLIAERYITHTAIAMCLVIATSLAPQALASGLAFTEVLGANDVPLNVVEAGSPEGIEVLFIHGVSQSYLSWQNQLNSDSLQDLRLVAFDLRGHGNSAKPWLKEDYHNSKIWAEDVAAVIEAKQLEATVIIAWSYAGAVLMDYIRHHGTEHVAGINLVANTAALVDRVSSTSPVSEAILKEMIAKQAFQRSANIEENIEYLKFSTPLLTNQDLGSAWTEQAMLTGIMTPAYVRRALLGRKIDNKDLVNALAQLPILLTYGSEDGSVTEPMAQDLKSRLPQTRVSLYKEVGHSPFAEAANRFNSELLDLVNAAQKKR